MMNGEKRFCPTVSTLEGHTKAVDDTHHLRVRKLAAADRDVMSCVAALLGRGRG